MIIKVIAEKIEAFLRRGFIADESLEHYLASAHGLENIQMLCDLSEEEIHELLAPFMLPSHELMISLEENIPSHGISMRELSGEVSCPENVEFALFGGRVRLAFFKNDLLYFLEKLKTDKDLSFLATGDADSSDKYLWRNQIRHSSTILTEIRQREINQLFQRLSVSHQFEAKTVHSIIKTLLQLWNEYPHSHTEELIYNKKQLLQKQLDAVKIFEEHYASRYSMDYLMVNRITPPPINIEETESYIQNLNRLSSVLYGRVIETGPGEKNIPAIRRGDRNSAQELIDFFSDNRKQ